MIPSLECIAFTASHSSNAGTIYPSDRFAHRSVVTSPVDLKLNPGWFKCLISMGVFETLRTVNERDGIAGITTDIITRHSANPARRRA